MTKQHVILLRRLSGMTRQQFADRIGVSNQHINAIERGVYGITGRTAALIKTAFNLSDEDLIELSAWGRKIN